MLALVVRYLELPVGVDRRRRMAMRQVERTQGKHRLLPMDMLTATPMGMPKRERTVMPTVMLVDLDISNGVLGRKAHTRTTTRNNRLRLLHHLAQNQTSPAPRPTAQNGLNLGHAPTATHQHHGKRPKKSNGGKKRSEGRSRRPNARRKRRRKLRLRQSARQKPQRRS